MSLQQVYTRFLASPDSNSLFGSPSMHFITTLITINSAEEILKYLTREPTFLKKRIEKPLSAIESSDSLVLEMETEMEFITSGGNYLPALDDNFLADQVVMVPIIHIVNFEDGLIKQIRLYWDQSCLLKQIGVIGRTGRNWPIKDGRDQCKLVRTSAAGTKNAPGAPKPAPVAVQNGNGNRTRAGTRKGSASSVASSTTTNPTRDPHRSLSLFTPQEDDTERIKGPAIAPRSSAKPPSRDLVEIIGTTENGEPVQKQPETFMARKGNNGFTAQRTYEIGSENDKTPKNVERTVILDPKKYHHFEFTDEPEPAQAALTKQSKHSSSWGFEDFTTPEKRPLKHRKDEEIYFGCSDDEEKPEPINILKKMVPRKDSETVAKMKMKPTGAGRPGVNYHFEMADESPVGSHVKRPTQGKAALNNISGHWGENDSPNGGFFEAFGKEEATGGINIAGDGIGTRKSQGREWNYDDKVPGQRVQAIDLPIRTTRSQTQSAEGNDESYFGCSDDDEEKPEPIKIMKKMVLREDSETHFSIKDTDTPETVAKMKPTGAGRPGVNSHFEIADESPVGSRVKRPTQGKAALNNISGHWGENDSPSGGFFEAFGKEEATGGINIAGDGIGTRKSQGREWNYDDNVPGQRVQAIDLPIRTTRSQTHSAESNNESYFGCSDDEEKPEPIDILKKMVPRKDSETVAKMKPTGAGRPGVNSHFEIADESPVGSRVKRPTQGKAALNNISGHWGENDSPSGGFFEAFGKEEATGGINIAGDGIGTRKFQGREWNYDDKVPGQRVQAIDLPIRTTRSQTRSAKGDNTWGY